MTFLTVPTSRQGPPGIANGGWLAGLLTNAAGDPHSGTVTLRRPTPVATELTVLADGLGSAALSLEGLDLATVTPGLPAVVAPPPVSWDTALTASRTYVGLSVHPFPGCLVCGSARDASDALCLRPGRVSHDMVATPWVPAAWTDDGTGHVTLPAVWAALDCPSAWAIDDEGRAVVLGRITARVATAPQVGAQLVVVGWAIERTSRRIAQCGSAVYDEQGTVLAVSTSTWFAVNVDTFAR